MQHFCFPMTTNIKNIATCRASPQVAGKRSQENFKVMVKHAKRSDFKTISKGLGVHKNVPLL